MKNLPPAAPATESIKYAGSKLKLLPHILALVADTGAKTILDGFSGTTRVAQALAQRGYAVRANDLSVWSEVLGRCYLLAGTQPARHYEELIAHLNAVPGFAGWFTENYGGAPQAGSAIQPDGLKKPWQIQVTQKLDGIRAEIARLKLVPLDEAVALTSLMLGLDKVDNTLGHFSAYLRAWPPRAYKPLVLTCPRFCPPGAHAVTRADIFDVCAEPADLCYYDPPYGSGNLAMPPSRVRYSAYYHLWTTVCLNDQPAVFGKAKRRQDSADSQSASEFEEFRKNSAGDYLAVEAVGKLIAQTTAPKIILSYAPGAEIINNAVRAVIMKHGTVRQTLRIDYKKNVMAEMVTDGVWQKPSGPHQEILFYIIKN